MRDKEDGMETREQEEQPRNLAPIQSEKKSQSEIFARLLVFNPAIFSQFFGIGTLAFLDQFLKLWPSRRIQALPYLSIPAVALAGLGWGIGASSIKNPNDEIRNDPFKRSVMTVMEGVGAIFPFLLGDLIEIYCRNSKNLDSEGRCMVSEDVFWKNFFTAPAVLSALYIAWNTISPAQKYFWLSASKTQRMLVIGTDLLTKILFYSRIIQASLMLNINSIPKPLLYEGVAAPATLIVLGGEIFQHRHRQKIDSIMMYLMIANLMVYLKEVSSHEISHDYYPEQPHSWPLILKLSVLPLLFVAGVIFSVYYRRSYFQAREEIRDLPSRKSHVFPVETNAAEALRDPIQLNRFIDSILNNPEAKQMLFQRLKIDSNNRTESPPNNIDEAMKDPVYRAIIKMTMEQCGHEVVEQQDDELVTVIDDSESRQASASLLLSNFPSYNATSDALPLENTMVADPRLPQNQKPLLFSPGFSSHQRTDDFKFEDVTEVTAGAGSSDKLLPSQNSSDYQAPPTRPTSSSRKK